MGIIKHKDVFSAKYVTAIITDSNDRGFFVPIKKGIGDYFVTELAGNVFAFTLKNARMITYREFLAKSVKFVQYDTCHYKSLNSSQKELELVLEKNQLPKMNRVQLAALTILGRKETITRKDGHVDKVSKGAIQREVDEVKDKFDNEVQKDELRFKPHDISLLIKELEKRQEDFPEEATNMINYLESLDIDHIVTPVRKLTESLQEDLITTQPSFLGEMLPRMQRLDNEHRGISNKPVKPLIPYLKLVLVIFMVVALISFIYLGIEQGWFDSILSAFPNPSSFAGVSTAFKPPPSTGTKDCSDATLQKKYPEPIQLKVAIDEGRETCKLSPTMQELVDNVELPKVEPKP